MQEKRLRVDIASLKQDVSEEKIAIWYVLGIRQVADVLMKKTANPELMRKVLRTRSLRVVLNGMESRRMSRGAETLVEVNQRYYSCSDSRIFILTISISSIFAFFSSIFKLFYWSYSIAETTSF